MVVDAEPLVRWVLVQLATDAGFAVIEAHDAEAALTLARNAATAIDLVFLSCPRMHADLTLASAIKQCRPTARVHLMTAFRADAFITRALALGVDRVLIKPMDYDNVRAIIHAARENLRVSADRRSEPFRLRIPPVLQRARNTMHAQLARAGGEPGGLGSAAKQADRLLQTHVLREEQFALPPLGLLPILAAGFIWPEMRPAIGMAANLRVDLHRMLEDHAAIIDALQTLRNVAERAGRSDLVLLAQTLTQHAETEAEVLYPATIVTGKFLETHFAKNGIDSGSLDVS